MSARPFRRPVIRPRAGSAAGVALALAAVLLWPAAVPAQPTPLAARAVTIELTQHKVVTDARGVETLADASSVNPGDVIEYRATYANRSDRPVAGLLAELPIPEGLAYHPRSARPGADLVKAATRDGVYASEPLLQKTALGKAEPLPYNQYRSLRWNLGQLPAGGVAAVSARATVEVVVPPAPKPVPDTSQAAAPAR